MLLYSVLYLITSIYIFKTALGCRCVDSTVENDYNRSELVFTGMVIDIVPTRNGGSFAINFQIRKVWKGDPLLDIIQIITCKDPTCCGVSFNMGQEYEVFAWKGEGDYYATSICSKTQMSNAEIVNQLETISRMTFYVNN
jgi:hypothetical protein